jgi:oxygen-dependent protoporphyrinogen oxidase
VASDCDVLVIGAGLSGLATAHFARQRKLQVVVVEKSQRAGGKIRSEQVNGNVVEHGPLGFLDKDLTLRQMATELGVPIIESAPAEKVRFLLFNGRLKKMPSSVISFLNSPLLSLAGKLRLLCEPFIPRKTPANGEDESAQSFAQRRLGGNVTKALFDPFVSGIYAGDPASMSAESSFPLLTGWERSHGSITRGAWSHMRQKRLAPKNELTGKLCSFPLGMEQLVLAAADACGEHLLLQTSVIKMSRQENRWRVELSSGVIVSATHVVFACPASVAAHLLQVQDIAACLSANPLAVVTAFYNPKQVNHPIAQSSFGFLAARSEKFRPLGVQFPSAIFPQQSQAQVIQIRVLIGGAFDSDICALSDADLQHAALSQLVELLGIEGEPQAVSINRVGDGIPQYDLGHAEVQRNSIEYCRGLGGIHLVGDYFCGVGVVKSVQSAAQVVAHF